MAGRIRSIKPELLEDEKAAELSDAAWRLFVSSWLLADDHGRFRAGGRFLAASVWQDTGKAARAEKARDELVAAGRIALYEVEGDTYAEIPTWARHQRIDNAGKPRVPPPPTSNREVTSRFAANLGEPPRVSANLGDSPLEPPRVAARPPTSDQDHDLRPPTPTTEGADLAGAALPGKAPVDGRPEAVFAAYLEGWARVVGTGSPPKLDEKRRRLVLARLKSFPLADLEAAARGVWRSSWHLEKRAEGSASATAFELVMRDGAHVEQFRDVREGVRSNPRSTLQQTPATGRTWKVGEES